VGTLEGRRNPQSQLRIHLQPKQSWFQGQAIETAAQGHLSHPFGLLGGTQSSQRTGCTSLTASSKIKLATPMPNRLPASLGNPEICIIKLETCVCKIKHLLFCTELGSRSKRPRCPILASAHLSAHTPRLGDLPPSLSASPACWGEIQVSSSLC